MQETKKATRIKKYANLASGSGMVPVFNLDITGARSQVTTIEPKVVHINYAPIRAYVHQNDATKVNTTQARTNRRVEMLRAQTVLDEFHTKKRSRLMQSAAFENLDWSKVITYSVAILLLVLLIGPFFDQVSSVLAAL